MGWGPLYLVSHSVFQFLTSAFLVLNFRISRWLELCISATYNFVDYITPGVLVLDSVPDRTQTRPSIQMVVRW